VTATVWHEERTRLESATRREYRRESSPTHMSQEPLEQQAEEEREAEDEGKEEDLEREVVED